MNFLKLHYNGVPLVIVGHFVVRHGTPCTNIYVGGLHIASSDESVEEIYSMLMAGVHSKESLNSLVECAPTSYGTRQGV